MPPIVKPLGQGREERGSGTRRQRRAAEAARGRRESGGGGLRRGGGAALGRRPRVSGPVGSPVQRARRRATAAGQGPRGGAGYGNVDRPHRRARGDKVRAGAGAGAGAGTGDAGARLAGSMTSLADINQPSAMPQAVSAHNSTFFTLPVMHAPFFSGQGAGGVLSSFSQCSRPVGQVRPWHPPCVPTHAGMGGASAVPAYLAASERVPARRARPPARDRR